MTTTAPKPKRSLQKIVCTATICPNDPKGDRRTGERKCAHCSSKRYLAR